MKKINKFKVFLVFLSILKQAYGEEVKPELNISGHIEATYNINLLGGSMNTLRSFDAKANNILLNSATLFVQRGDENSLFSYTLKIGFGSDMMVLGVMMPEPIMTQLPYQSIGVDVYEAYGKVKLIDKKLWWIFGRFAAFEGIEVIEGPDNPTISRGYLFGLAEPYTHVGGYFLATPTEKLFFKIGVIQGWDMLFDNNKMKTGIAELGFTDIAEILSFDIAYYVGPEQKDNDSNLRHSGDITGVLKLGKVDIWFQGNGGFEEKVVNGKDDTWFGGGVQPVIRVADFILGLRYEFFKNQKGSRTGFENLLVHNFTISPGIKKGGLLARVEFRFDVANQPIFEDRKGDKKKNLPTVSMGFSYSF